MILKVANEGLLIPKDLLDGAEEFDLRREGDRLVVVPMPKVETIDDKAPVARRRSVYELGSKPVTLGVSDASVRLDDYLSGDPHGEQS